MTTFNREDVVLGNPAVAQIGEGSYPAMQAHAPIQFGQPLGRVLETIVQRNQTRSAIKKGFKRHMRTGYFGDKAAIMFFKACEARRTTKKEKKQ